MTFDQVESIAPVLGRHPGDLVGGKVTVAGCYQELVSKRQLTLKTSLTESDRIVFGASADPLKVASCVPSPEVLPSLLVVVGRPVLQWGPLPTLLTNTNQPQC